MTEAKGWAPVVWLIVVIGLALRLGWALLAGVDPIESDPQIYAVFSKNIALHGTYGFEPDQPGAFWAVGASAIYAGAYLLFGVGETAVIVTNLLFSVLILVGTYDLGRRWFGETTGRVALGIMAFWPTLILFTAVMASELHFLGLMLVALMAWDRAVAPGGLARRAGFLALAGLLFAGATYVRPIGLLIPAALAIAAVLRNPRQAGPTLVAAVVVTGLIFAAISPWSARNERVLGERVFLSTNFWPNFWIGNNPLGDGQFMYLPPETENMTEIERAHFMKEIALDNLRTYPVLTVLKWPMKAVRMHGRETIGVAWNRTAINRMVGRRGVDLATTATSAWWFAAMAGGFVGIGVLVRRRGPWAALMTPPVWLWLYITAVHSVILVGDRFHLPAVPFVAILAALAVSALLEWRRPG